MLIFREGQTFTEITKTWNTYKYIFNKQNIGAKVYIQEGNSPEY
jgi:hypothetical protein